MDSWLAVAASTRRCASKADTGECLRTLRAERRYERLNITGLTGVTEMQRAALFALGAVEQTGQV